MSKLPIVERLEACPDIANARIVAPGMRTPEVVVPASLRDEAANTITELVSALKDAPEPYEYMSKADFASLPYPMRSFVDSHKTWLRKVDTALSNTRGDTK